MPKDSTAHKLGLNQYAVKMAYRLPNVELLSQSPLLHHQQQRPLGSATQIPLLLKAVEKLLRLPQQLLLQARLLLQAQLPEEILKVVKGAPQHPLRIRQLPFLSLEEA